MCKWFTEHENLWNASESECESKKSSTFVYLFTLVAVWSSLSQPSNQRNINCVLASKLWGICIIFTQSANHFFPFLVRFCCCCCLFAVAILLLVLYFNHRSSLAAFPKTFFWGENFSIEQSRKCKSFFFFGFMCMCMFTMRCARTNITSSHIFSHFVLFFLIFTKNY